MPSTWTIDHACGHQADRDLGHKAVDERAGFARWLSTRSCTACWRETRTADAADKEAWLEQRRAAEQEAAEAWSRQYAMPPLEGTERAVAWAVRCRHDLVSAAYTALVVEGELTEQDWERVEDAARTVTRAGWWIDQRDNAPENLPELVEAASSRDRPNENPF